jgi:hypothetical protein
MNDKNETVISEEKSREQLDLLLDYYDLDLAKDLAVEGDKGDRAAEALERKLLQAVQRGRLEIAEDPDEGLVISQHLRRPVKGVPNPLIYKEITGRAKTAMGKSTDNHARIYALLGSLSGEGGAAIMRLRGVDMSLAEVLGAVFLMV